MAFLLRAVVALAGDFVIHPDEIYQHLEPAHYAVFGNGVLFWEFFYGARNWIVPGAIAGLLWLCDLIGLGEPQYYVLIVKLFFCLLSLLLPWGAYQYSRSLMGEHAGRLSLVLVCIWPLLVGYGHKPFTEFIATYLIFAFLGLATTPLVRKPGRVFTAAAILTLAAFIRMQFAPVAALLWVLFVLGRGKKHVQMAFAAGIFVALLVALIETAAWGWPYKSYVSNFLFNYHKGELEKFTSNFYLPRLLYATGGLLLLAAFALFRLQGKKWRRDLLLGAILIIVFGLHYIQPHKEMRFVFVLIPVCLLLAASVIDSLSKQYRKWPFRATVAYGVVFSAAMLANLLPGIVWYHYGNSFERGEIHFLRGHSSMWNIYRELAKKGNDVTGVLHFNESYFNTPGYYYLHKKIPFYNNGHFEKMLNENYDLFAARGQIPDLDFFFSHVVKRKEEPILPGFTVIADHGDYQLLESRRVGKPVITWDRFSLFLTGPAIDLIFSRYIGDEPERPESPRFVLGSL